MCKASALDLQFLNAIQRKKNIFSYQVQVLRKKRFKFIFLLF